MTGYFMYQEMNALFHFLRSRAYITVEFLYLIRRRFLIPKLFQLDIFVAFMLLLGGSCILCLINLGFHDFWNIC